MTEAESEQDRYEFYVSAGSKDLIRHLSFIMQRNGYVGLADGGGKMHYVVDGSKNLYETAANIRAVLREQREAFADENQGEAELRRKNLIRDTVDDVLEARGFKPTLKGYIYLRALLRAMMTGREELTKPDKKVYAAVCERYNTGRKQLDRVIHYSLKKAGIAGSNSEAIMSLAEEIKALTEAEKLFKAETAEETEPAAEKSGE